MSSYNSCPTLTILSADLLGGGGGTVSHATLWTLPKNNQWRRACQRGVYIRRGELASLRWWQRPGSAFGLLPVLLHLMNACMHVQFCSSFEKAAKSGAQDNQLGRAPLRVLLAEEAEMEGVPPMHLSAALALNLGFTMVQKYSIGTAI